MAGERRKENDSHITIIIFLPRFHNLYILMLIWELKKKKERRVSSYSKPVQLICALSLLNHTNIGQSINHLLSQEICDW